MATQLNTPEDASRYALRAAGRETGRCADCDDPLPADVRLTRESEIGTVCRLCDLGLRLAALEKENKDLRSQVSSLWYHAA